MVMISAKLTGVMLAVVPPVSIGAVIYGRYLRKLSKQTQEALGEMSKVSGLCLPQMRSNHLILTTTSPPSATDRRRKVERLQDGRLVQRSTHRGSIICEKGRRCVPAHAKGSYCQRNLLR